MITVVSNRTEIHHSTGRCLLDLGLIESMGRVVSAGDGAAMELFFALLQHNVLDPQSRKSCEDLPTADTGWIELTSRRRRRQRGFGHISPIDREAATVHHIAIA